MFTSLVLENSKCRAEWADIVIPLLIWGASAGGFGSLVCLLLDSVLLPWLSFGAARFNLGCDDTTNTILFREKEDSARPH
jgi:hypothetical protein